MPVILCWVFFMRIAGVDIPSNKKLYIGLTRIYGVGVFSAIQICKGCGLDPDIRVHTLSDDDVSKIVFYIKENYTIEGDLRSQIMMNIRRLITLGVYRGLRHRKNLPCRGQRTSTNAKTRRKLKNKVSVS